MSSRIVVAVVDEHPLFREGVKQALGRCGCFRIAGEGACFEDALRLAQADLADVVLLDIRIPGGGIEAARAMATARPDLKIVVLTASEREEHVAEALEAGARGYVLKGCAGSELADVIKSVLEGHSYVTPKLAARLLKGSHRPTGYSAKRISALNLTKREYDVLRFASMGRVNKEIADALSISEKTVKQHMSVVMQKLSVRNRVRAVLEFQKLFESAPLAQCD